MKFTAPIVALCLSMAATVFAQNSTISTDGSCGGTMGFTCLGSTFGDSCSAWGWWYGSSPYPLYLKLQKQRITPSQRKYNHSQWRWLPASLRHLLRKRGNTGWELWRLGRSPLHSGFRKLLLGEWLVWEFWCSLWCWMVSSPFLLPRFPPLMVCAQ